MWGALIFLLLLIVVVCILAYMVWGHGPEFGGQPPPPATESIIVRNITADGARFVDLKESELPQLRAGEPVWVRTEAEGAAKRVPDEVTKRFAERQLPLPFGLKVQ